MPSEKSMKICILDVNYEVEERGGVEEQVIKILGKTKDGKSVLVLDRSFDPYFYVEPKPGLSESDIETLKGRILELEIEGQKPKKIEETEKNFLGKPVKLLKIFINLPSDVPKFRDIVKDWSDIREEYEHGIPFYKRYVVDRGIVPMNWVSIEGDVIKSELDFDIVIESGKGGIKLLEDKEYPKFNILAFDLELIQKDGEENIVVASFMDNRGFKKVIVLAKNKVRGAKNVLTEQDILKEFMDTVKKRDPDIIVGYNTDRFDFIKLGESSEKYKTPLILGRDKKHMVFRRRGRISAARIGGRVHIDLYDFIEHILGASLSTEVLTLDRVAKELLGIGKENLRWKDIEKAWKGREFEKISKYCLKDSRLTLKLAEYILPQIFEISRVSGQTPFDVARMGYSQLVEWLLIRKAHEENELAPNRPKYDEVMRRRRAVPYIGGYVHIPKEGIHENIALFDFAALYPSITITHNISPETLDCMCCKKKRENKSNMVPGQEHYYCRRHKGFVPKVIEELVKKRMEIKEKMKKAKPNTVEYNYLCNRQYALKIIANASYGYYGYPGSRWYSRVCAESITAWGRMYIKKVIGMAEKMGYEVIYGDTDSLFLKVRNKKEAKEFLNDVNKSLPGVMELDFRDLYKSGIFVLGKTGVAAKKRYALIDSKGNIVIRGFEKVRRDWANIAKDTQEMVLKAILIERSPSKAVKIVRNIIQKLKSNKIMMDDLIIYTQITKPISEYEQIGPHVAAAKKAVERGRIVKEGSTISYIITKGTGSISSRAEPAEDADNYDPDYYINNQVIPAAMRVLAGLGYREEDFLKKEKIEQISLEKYIKK